MADSKRNSKVATPTPNTNSNSTPTPSSNPKANGSVPQQMQETLDTLPSAIGARIKLTTTTSHSHEGTLYTYCPVLKLIALNTSPAPPNPTSNPLSTNPANYALFPVSQITSLNVLSLPDEKRVNGTGVQGERWESLEPQIKKVDIAKLKAREEDKVRKMIAAEAKRGRGVSPEAQGLFNALDRMYATRWHGTEIIVADAVIIAAPYTAEACKAPKEKAQVLAQIRKVVEGERRKMADRARTGASGSPAPSMGQNQSQGLRKGG